MSCVVLIVNGLTRGTLGLNIDLNYGEETLKALICAHKSTN